MTLRRGRWLACLALLLMGVAFGGYRALFGQAAPPAHFAYVSRPPRLDPDYSGCTVPPNIAPLNFTVQEPGTRYCVRVSAAEADGFVVHSRTAEIVLPERDWRDVLAGSRGDLFFDIYVSDEAGAWQTVELKRTFRNISAFGQDEAGELYLVDDGQRAPGQGRVLRFVPSN